MTLGVLGTTSILLTLAGYWAGRYGETTGRGRAYAAPLAAFAISAAAGIGGVALHFLLGQPVSAREALVTLVPSALVAALVAVPAPSSLSRAPPRAAVRARASGGVDVSNPPYGEPRTPSSRFLPPDPAVEAPYRLTPGLALRVGVLGVIALLVFAVLFFRLWSLQVLSGRHVPGGRSGEPAAHDPDRGAARDDPRPRRQADRRQRPRNGRQAVGRRPAPSRVATTSSSDSPGC